MADATVGSRTGWGVAGGILGVCGVLLMGASAPPSGPALPPASCGTVTAAQESPPPAGLGQSAAFPYHAWCYQTLAPALVRAYRGHYAAPTALLGRTATAGGPVQVLAVPVQAPDQRPLPRTAPLVQLMLYYDAESTPRAAIDCYDPAFTVVRESARTVPADLITQAPPGVDSTCRLWRTVTYSPDGAVVLEVYSHHGP